MIALSVPEVRNLVLRLVWPHAHEADAVPVWSDWLYAHQYRASARCITSGRRPKLPDD